MNFASYIDMFYRKIGKAVDLTEPLMFEDVLVPDPVYSLETMEHFRQPPAVSEMKPIESGSKWGREYSTLWLRCGFTVPSDCAGETLCATVGTDAWEMLCFRNGQPAGLINSQGEFLGGMHSAMFITKNAAAGEMFDLAFELYCGHVKLGCDPHERYYNNEPEAAGEFTKNYTGIKIVKVDRRIYRAIVDLKIALELARLEKTDFIQSKAHTLLEKAYPYLVQDVLDHTREEIAEGCAKVSEVLAPLFEKTGGDESRGYVGLLGHSHMDTAWLWPVEETIRKCARTYSMALEIMDNYPEYTFIQSSALHTDWMREYYPSIFDRIKERVAEGRYEPNGGVWVECDCNITGGESMVRQFLYGQRFNMKYLNYRSDSFWLPDTFGYNASIPQIMQECGCRYFYTTKIEWNDLNSFPDDTFIWRGIDGSEVLTHFTTIQTIPTPKTVDDAIRYRIYDKKINNMKLNTFGFGDGGGGPTFTQLEMLERTVGLPGLPVCEPTTASAFMHKLEKKKDSLHVHDGELYLEAHRGTLTTMHDVKKYNRMAEKAVRDFELMNVLSGKPVNPERDRLIKIMLKNQFHDILPGTCIKKVYDRYFPEMRKMISDTESETAKYLAGLCDRDETTVSVFNQLSFDRNDILTLEGKHSFENAECQTYTDRDGNEKTDVRIRIGAMEAFGLKRGASLKKPSAFTMNGKVLETPFYTAEFDDLGFISCLTDKKNGRRINKKGTSLGQLFAGEDFPSRYDNWEIEYDAFMKLKPCCTLTKSETVSDGSVEFRIRNTYKVARFSTAVIDTVFYSDLRRIDYDVKLDWQDHHTLLKAGFDLNIRSATVKNEIQFGHMDRPNTKNNGEEFAKFEVCNIKWSDLSESRYGVALLNDCKYGLSCYESNLMLTLDKGGRRPDPVTGFGVHYMKYSLLPHEGGYLTENVIRPAYEFNNAPLFSEGILHAPELFEISAPNIICEAVKCAEDIENAYVLRLYECERNETDTILSLHGAGRVYETNMLEEIKRELVPDEKGNVELRFHPFEIKTILIERG
ncbi:MAG: alpha-mannosidase [Clostridia bacterium]|nr:alpha-mannosidase [Clostridia bacterium]